MPSLAGRLRRTAARVASAFARPKADAPPAVRLDDVRRRLELLLAAVYGREIPIVPAEPPSRPGWLRRWTGAAPAHLRPADALAASDGERIHLPRELPAEDGVEAALARYRLLAVAQAERLARGTAAHHPGDDDALARDLYLLAESAAVDAAVARTAPGLVPALAAERAAALARRPGSDRLTAAEREVEALARHLLDSDPAGAPPGLPADATPGQSLAWARATAARLRAGRGRYRGLAPVAAWGTVLPPKPGAAPVIDSPFVTDGRVGVGAPRPGGPTLVVAPPTAPPPGASPTPPTGAADARREASAGADREPTPETDAPPEDGKGGESPSGAGEVGMTRSRDRADGASGAPPEPGGIDYPEWDWRAGRHHRPGATVRLAQAAEADVRAVDAVLERHAALVRRLREQFERLRARRTRLRRQRDGEEPDLDACVAAAAELRAGLPVDDRLYLAVRPARRELAIALLVDVSGSTSDPVEGTRIIDIEKTALLLICEAFEALGDRYSVLTFSGRGAANVRMRTLKDFGETGGEAVRRRIAALRPEGYTRMGAAVRHAAALLARQGTRHRLLLILSDGKPCDEFDYDGRYGIEDTRQAVAEARASGVFPFCLTVDRAASAYLPHVFGPAGHLVLRDPRQLPLALARVVKHLLSS